MDLQHKKLTTSSYIYNDLCFKIEKLKYKPGEELSENELCKKYDSSRHMVREALAKLKGRQLIEVLPQRGTFVSLIDMHYIEDILFLREATEQEAIQRIIRSDNVDTIWQILNTNIIEQRKLILQNNYSDEFHQLDLQFHNAIMARVGKTAVTGLISQMFIHVRRWRNLEIQTSDRMEQIICEHECIATAIKTRDSDAARTFTHIHLDTVARYGSIFIEKYRSFFKQYEDQFPQEDSEEGI